jgi:hypothetical protein
MVRRFAVLLLGAVLATPLAASDIEQRLERLEAQMQRLLERLDAQDAAEPPAVPGVQPAAEPSASPSVVTQVPPASDAKFAAASYGEVRLRYYLGAEPMIGDALHETPLADGLFRLQESLRFDPATYGVAERGILSRYRDPSQYRSAGVLVEGIIDLPSTGSYVLHIAPKPAREGGGSPVANEMTVRLQIAGESVIEIDGVRSWRTQSHAHELPAGSHAISLWAVSNSPGYGPPPIDSRLEISVGVPGRAGLVPLARMMRTSQ